MNFNQGELNELALFGGAGGGILGGGLLGWRTVCAVEWESYPACVLAARQNDGILPPFPIWDDVQTFDGKPWRGIVDVVSGGFPCQDISSAGRGAGIEGSRSGMWKHMARIIGEVRPRFAFLENSPMLVGRGAAMVIGDLTEMGYDCEWCIISASDCGAPHKRDRFWLLAHTNDYEYRANGREKGKEDSIQSECREKGLARQPCRASCDTEILADTNLQHGQRRPESLESISNSKGSWSELNRCCNKVADTHSTHGERNKCTKRGAAERSITNKPSWWDAESNFCRVANGVAYRVDRLKALGNGQVPIVAATAFRILSGAAVK